jgi:hypothetical protein
MASNMTNLMRNFKRIVILFSSYERPVNGIPYSALKYFAAFLSVFLIVILLIAGIFVAVFFTLHTCMAFLNFHVGALR